MTSRNHGFDLREDDVEGLLEKLREWAGDSEGDVGVHV